MREDWKYCTFADTYPIIMGKTPARADNLLWDKKKVSHNLWVSISDISNNEGGYIYDTEEYVSDLATLKMRKVPKGSLLMSFKLTIGKMAFAGDDLYTNEAIIAIPEKRKYNLRFLYYYLSGYEWSTLTDGAEKVKGKTLNKASIGRILLPEIPLAEQERIVALLDDQFAKIDQLKANAELQLQAAKDLFQSALNQLLTPQEGWEKGCIGSMATILHGKNQKEVEDPTGKYPIYGSGGNIMGYSNEYLCEEGTTILGRKGTINNPIYISEKFWNVDTAFGICAKKGVDKRFLYYIVKSINWQEKNTGTTLPSLTQTVVLSFPISFPSLAEQERIAARLYAISEKVKALQANYDQTITLCNDLKQSLLKSIFA